MKNISPLLSLRSLHYGMNWYDRKMERGLSSLSYKHNLLVNWTYDLPFAQSMTGVGGCIWKLGPLSNITTIQSGTPFKVRIRRNPSHNLNTTSFSMHEQGKAKLRRSTNSILGGPDRYWDVIAFELPPLNECGSRRRSTLIGPGRVELNVSLLQSLRVRDGRVLQFRAEAFNWASHPNFANSIGARRLTNVPRAAASNRGAASLPQRTASYQIQFGLKLTF